MLYCLEDNGMHLQVLCSTKEQLLGGLMTLTVVVVVVGGSSICAIVVVVCKVHGPHQPVTCGGIKTHSIMPELAYMGHAC